MKQTCTICGNQYEYRLYSSVTQHIDFGLKSNIYKKKMNERLDIQIEGYYCKPCFKKRLKDYYNQIISEIK